MNGAFEGRAKVALAREHVRRVNPWTPVATLADDLATLTPGHFADLSVLVLAVDNDRARVIAARLGLAARVAVVDAAARADLFVARVTVSAPEGPCPCDGWTVDRLARAGEDVGAPCAGVDGETPYASTLSMAQAGAALAVHQVLALVGATTEPAWPGHELRLDLHAGRLERFRRPRAEACAADHALAAGARAPIPLAPHGTSLGALMSACGAGSDATVVLATVEIIAAAACTGCGARVRPYRPARLEPCNACGAPLAALRRVRRVRWGDAAPHVAALAASAWFQPGDAFAVVDGDSVSSFAFAAPPLAWEAGRPWDEAVDAPRLARLPRGYDLGRIRAARLGLVGLGNVGAAILQAVAVLPWGALLLCDRDAIEVHNLASHAMAAAAAGGPA